MIPSAPFAPPNSACSGLVSAFCCMKTSLPYASNMGNDDDDEWGSILGKHKEVALAPDVARRLLELNPAMREKGMNTNMVVEQSRQASKAKQQAKSGQAKPEAAPGAKPSSAGNESIMDVMTRLKRDIS